MGAWDGFPTHKIRRAKVSISWFGSDSWLCLEERKWCGSYLGCQSVPFAWNDAESGSVKEKKRKKKSPLHEGFPSPFVVNVSASLSSPSKGRDSGVLSLFLLTFLSF